MNWKTCDMRYSVLPQEESAELTDTLSRFLSILRDKRKFQGWDTDVGHFTRDLVDQMVDRYPLLAQADRYHEVEWFEQVMASITQYDSMARALAVHRHFFGLEKQWVWTDPEMLALEARIKALRSEQERKLFVNHPAHRPGTVLRVILWGGAMEIYVLGGPLGGACDQTEVPSDATVVEYAKMELP